MRRVSDLNTVTKMLLIVWLQCVHMAIEPEEIEIYSRMYTLILMNRSKLTNLRVLILRMHSLHFVAPLLYHYPLGMTMVNTQNPDQI